MLVFREAGEADLEAVVGLHALDLIGAHGDAWTPEHRPAYERAFATIASHPDHTLFVGEIEGRVVATFLLSLLPGLTSHGATHAELRSVQVHPDMRSRGLGAALVAFAETEARRRGASKMTLVSSLRRVDAHRFYQRLGFARSHAGFSKSL
jgi:GNAT superfamily N-acetyltransferase